MENDKKIRLGISQCLLGDNVRWDGGHKLDRYLTLTLGQFIEYVPVCPEVEAGFGVPREPLRQEGDPENPRLISFKTRTDLTDRMVSWSKEKVRQLENENLFGFIFKSGSPSCDMIRIKVYSGKGSPVKKGVGFFAREFMTHFPLIPTEDESRLHNSKIRKNFIERIFTFNRWRELVSKKKTAGNLMNFHTSNKLVILSHSPRHYRLMGQGVATLKSLPIQKAYDQYQTMWMKALRLESTVKKNMNVLQHIMGYLKKQINRNERQALLDIFEQYRNEEIPLIVPKTLINHYLRTYDQPYLKRQTYLNSHPVELKLRTHM